MLDRTPTRTTDQDEPVVVLILSRSRIRRWAALGAIILTAAIVAPSPVRMTAAHDPICTHTFLC